MKKFILSLLEKKKNWRNNFYLERINNKTYRLTTYKDFYNFYCFVYCTLKQYYKVNFKNAVLNTYIISEK